MNYKIIGKYIKKSDFNIPNPKTFFLLSKNIINYKINIDIKSIQVKQNIIDGLAKEGFTFDEDFVIIVLPNIVDISYGRCVGYTFTEHQFG